MSLLLFSNENLSGQLYKLFFDLVALIDNFLFFNFLELALLHFDVHHLSSVHEILDEVAENVLL